MDRIEYGKVARNEHYVLDPNVTYVNHGSYGPCPRIVYNELQRLRLLQEQNPDRWFRLSKYEYYANAIRAAAERLDCQIEQVTIVENATVGANAIIKSPLPTFNKKPGGSIFCTKLAYGAVFFTIEEAVRRSGMNIIVLDVQFPIKSKQALIDQFENELNKNDVDDIRLAVIDHITSATAVQFPIEELTELFHRRGIPVLVDGAHGPGQVYPKLSLKNLKCDFYIGTFHKWMYAPRGCSFLFVRDPKIAGIIQPGNTSWGYRPSESQLKLMTNFHLQFFHQGTRDDSAQLALPKALEFIDKNLGGFEEIHRYNSTLSQEAKTYLEERWNCKGTDLVCEDLQAPYLKMIRLPDLENYEKTDEEAIHLIHDLIEKEQIVSIILCVNGELYVRIATQIYNRIEDFIHFADAIDRLRKKN